MRRLLLRPRPSAVPGSMYGSGQYNAPQKLDRWIKIECCVSEEIEERGGGRNRVACPLQPPALATGDYGFARRISSLRAALADQGRRRLLPPSNYRASSLRQEWRESQRADEWGVDRHVAGS